MRRNNRSKVDAPGGTIREARTVCPDCMKKIPGRVVRTADRVSLRRFCEEHGATDMPLSRNPDFYCDWDRFYFSVLKRGRQRGKVINYWVVLTSRCQMQCSFCHADVQDRYAGEMSREDLETVIRSGERATLTFSGGEPTLHPEILRYCRDATRLGWRVQLATNGITLADFDYCARLKDAGVREARLSCEVLDPGESSPEFGRWLSQKLKAVDNLGRNGFRISLSPTIFKGVNEKLLLDALEYARDRRFVTNLSVNGFSWVGRGTMRKREEMIMPDEMMDIVCGRFGIKDRESVFTFQKAVFTLLQLLNVRACMYTQLLFFVRTKGALVPILDYLNMKRLKKAMKFWERFSGAPYPLRFAAFFSAAGCCVRPRSLILLKDVARMFLERFLNFNALGPPSRLLLLVLNTNCSPLSMDEAVSEQCMSGVFIKRGGKIRKTLSSYLLIEKEVEKRGRAAGPIPQTGA